MTKSIPFHYRKAVIFTVKFLVIYGILYVLHFAWIKTAFPNTEIFTDFTALQTQWLLSLWSENIHLSWDTDYPKIYLENSTGIVLVVYAGCNGVSLYIVFLAFVLAFFKPSLKLGLFVFLGLVVLNISNVFRAAALYYISIHVPDQLYFYHKYIFNIMLFLEVFGLWYYATKKIV